ncbi:hypothetical protein G7Y89_g15775 [Cudoniella acicularis]|uniref:MYND-type domain-containing protein n=1 Tax=Cudoniella acicularis TaxID=354080 RepID=A0A8H4QGF8_9HELO|nr:hypothetical protein G7Y89_g15775 [Cudoniella acicularis]
MAPTSTCVICNKRGANDCASCKSASYCSKACQVLDWPLHKLLCKKFKKLPSRPNNMPSQLAILLSADDPDPRLIWVPSPQEYTEYSETGFQNPITEPLLGQPITHSAERFVVTKNEVRGYELDHSVVLFARDNWLNDGSKPNQAALALTDWELPYDWRGNILIMSFKVVAKGREGIETYQNVTLGDLRTVVDYLRRYGISIERGTEHDSLWAMLKQITDDGEEKTTVDTRTTPTPNKYKEEKNVKGVIIKCKRDIDFDKKENKRWERYSEVSVAKDHAIWKEPSTEASRIMGLPLLVHQLPPNPALTGSDLDNPPATYLNLTVDPKKAEMWGFAPPEWQNQVGSVLVVRKDGKSLSREQAWALAEYMQFRVADALGDTNDPGDVRQRRATILKILNWKCFDAFLENFKVEMTDADGKDWSNVRSPFGTRENHRGEPF